LLVIFVPIQGLIFKRLALVRRTIAPLTDKRVKLMTEILAGIRIIKFFAWEKPFLGRLEQVRAPELDQVFRRSILNAIAIAIVFGVPILSATLTFTIYSWYNELQATHIFPVLAWFGQLRFVHSFNYQSDSR
jgi:ATP-binding cassette subfamily C (CFTR/MRP) protein 1